MKRIVFALVVVAVLVCTCIVPEAMAQRAAPKVTTVKVAGNISMLQVRGGNIGVSVGEDGILIIDDDYPNASEAIDVALSKLSKGELKYVLNTHHHGDHTGGNMYFGAKAPIVAHENVRSRLIGRKDLTDAAVRAGLPTITFADSVTLHFNGEDITVKHFPTGHTDSDSVVYFHGSKVLHMGDHYFAGAFPYVDLAGGGDVASYLNNVRAVIKRAEEADGVTIIPGHGGLATLDDLKAWEKDISEAVGIVRSGVEAGKSVDQLVEAGLPAKFADYGAGFVNEKRFISIVYQSLTR